MGAGHIKPIRERIKTTEAYKNLNNIRKQMTSKRNNILIIEHGVNVANHLGYEVWEKQSNFSFVNKSIVKELVE